jgi:hypothetical protein
MQSLADRAAQILTRLGQPALSLGELARMIRESGAQVSETVLVRSLLAEPDRFRVIEPWRSVGRTQSEAQDPPTPTTWIVAAAGGESAARPALRRLSASVLQLGWRVDAASAPDTARWFAMVLETERFRERARD